MEFTDLFFLFLFLPVSLAVYYVAGKRVREYVLLAISLLFYSIGSPRYFLLFLAASTVTVIVGRTLMQTKNTFWKRLLFLGGTAASLGLLLYYKYTDFAILSVNRFTGSSYELKHLLFPLGISFFTFKAISYLADIYTGKLKPDRKAVQDLLYLSFFAQVQSGPLTRCGDMEAAETGKREALFTDGAIRFLAGFNKKVLLANTLSNITNEVFSAPFENYSVSYAWLGAICYSMQLFFDFSGYSDMAIGISNLFGYPCMENFNYPYFTESVTKFWRRWHISLSQWFRDYVYIPLGGSRTKTKGRVYFNLLVVWLLTGLWHGASGKFVIWGLGYFAAISLERMTGLPDRIKSKALKFLYRIATLLFVLLQWVLFRADSLRKGLGYIRRMFFCQRNPLADARALYLLRDYFFFIVCAIFLCFPTVTWIKRKLQKHKTASTLFSVLTSAALMFLFLWAISFVVSGRNNPFVYANF